MMRGKQGGEGPCFSQALRALKQRVPTRIGPSLERIRALTALLDEPQLSYPSIHITGTNGKTTTARVVARLLEASGLTTGLYTSPHLESVTERLAYCGEPISQEEFAFTLSYLEPYLACVDGLTEIPVTYFEVLTAMAFVWFQERAVDVGVFEVGMGGRWDATNLVRGEVAVFCAVGLDHPELGSTPEEVAWEKAGILKPGCVGISARQEPGVLGVLRRAAEDLGVPLWVEGEDFAVEGRSLAVGGQVLDIRTPGARYEEVYLPLFGLHQAQNACLAVAAAEAFFGGRALSQEVVEEAFAAVSSPGRLEVFSRHPLVVLDGAHNPMGARAFASSVKEAFAWDRGFLVLGILGDKDIPGILREVLGLAEVVVVTRNTNPRSAPPEILAKEVRRAAPSSGVVVETVPDVPSALEAVIGAAGETDAILVTGSLYTVGEARSYLRLRGELGPERARRAWEERRE